MFGHGSISDFPISDIEPVAAAAADAITHRRFVGNDGLHPSQLNGRVIRGRVFHFTVAPIEDTRTEKYRQFLRSQEPPPSAYDGKVTIGRIFHYSPPDTAGTSIDKLSRYLQSQEPPPSVYDGKAKIARVFNTDPIGVPGTPIAKYRKFKYDRPNPGILIPGKTTRAGGRVFTQGPLDRARVDRGWWPHITVLTPAKHHRSFTTSRNIWEPDVQQTVTFDQEINREQTIYLSQTISFLHAALTNTSIFTLEQTVSFTDSLERELELLRSPEHTVVFEQLAKKGILDSASNAVAFANAVARGENPENIISFTGAATETAGPGALTPLNFSQDVSVQKTLNISVGHTVTFDHEALASNFQTCDDARYRPVGLPTIIFGDNNQVTLSCDTDSVILRNPQLGNSEDLEAIRSFQRSRAGTHKAYRASGWPDATIINLTFEPITRVIALEVLDFINSCLGKLITYVDQDDRTWECILVNPSTAIQPIDSSDCSYRVNLELDANPA